MGKDRGSSGAKECRNSLPAAAICLPCLLTVCSLTLAGCTDFNHNTNAPSDPLLGAPVKPLTQIPAQAPAAQVAVLPPTPVANPTLSTAALAAATPPPLDSGHDLRIGSPRTGSDAWAGQSVAAGTGTGAVLQRPELVAEPVSRTPTTPVATTPTSLGNSNGLTIEQAMLKARGAVYQQETFVNETGQWEFRCALPNPQNPRIRRTYVGRGPDSLSAIRVVLDQIDKDQEATPGKPAS
jgi:hypothetical protein